MMWQTRSGRGSAAMPIDGRSTLMVMNTSVQRRRWPGEALPGDGGASDSLVRTPDRAAGQGARVLAQFVEKRRRIGPADDFVGHRRLHELQEVDDGATFR